MSAVEQMRARRNTRASNLAFLDVMSCGLGAVILIFLIIKHNTDAGSVEAERVLEQLETMEREVEQFRNEIEEVARLNADEQALGSELLDQRESALARLNALEVRMTAQNELNRQLQRAVEESEKKVAEDIIETVGKGRENYVTGLQVKGQRIAILLDHSASMTDAKLSDIFRYKVSSEADRRASPKWQRAQRATKWLLARAPAGSEVAVVGFAEKGAVLSDGWFRTSEASKLSTVQRAMANLVPEGATNLEAGFSTLGRLSGRPTDVYLITDGLPTNGGRCAKGNKVTPKCRLSLFQAAQKRAVSEIGRAKMNVILLPLEGDWDAGPAYLTWAVNAGGTMISPPASWP